MGKHIKRIAFMAALTLCCTAKAGIISFEDDAIPAGFSISKGKLSVSTEKYKLGAQSLRIAWKGGAVLEMNGVEGLETASESPKGGMNLWIYNEIPVDDDLVFIFKDSNGAEVCRLPFHMDFKGWRCIWAKFRDDMGKPAKAVIASAEMAFPKSPRKGVTYIDMLEFVRTVSWQNMSDAQYKVNRTDFSLIPDFNRYRNTERKVSDPIMASKEDFDLISGRLERWYLGGGEYGECVGECDGCGRLAELRTASEKEFIGSGVAKAEKYTVGTPLFPHGAADKVDGEKCLKFKEINENILIPLALDYRKNGNGKSLGKILEIYDWFNDQGWADGSGMGTLTFERLRSCGYFHSLFLVRDRMPEDMLERELAALDWFSLFGICFIEPESKGEVADNLRGLAIAKLIYALTLPDMEERQTAMTAFKNYMDNALGLAPGYFGTIKPDYSGYHHRGAYHSAYYPHALYAGSFIAYLLHGTPYALDDSTIQILKNGLLNFRFFCAGLDVPAGTTGRFPKNQEVLQTLLPAFAYAAFCSEEPDEELVAALKRIIADRRNTEAIEEYASTVKSSLAYTSSAGEMEMVCKAAALPVRAEGPVIGSRFYPYSGLLVSKTRDYQFNIKGMSSYIWDFESSATENIHGRYISYGHIEYSDFADGRKSFRPEEKQWDWSFIPGTTAKVLPAEKLCDKGGADSGHRNFSDETFLAGVSGSGKASMFSVRLHDISYDKSFRADKSVFIFNDWLFCLGTDIHCDDRENHIATTLFQSFDGQGNVEKDDNGSIAMDGSFLYAVKEGDLAINCGKYTKAFIDHGANPDNKRYSYYIIPSDNKTLASLLLSDNSPLTVQESDNDAHIIRNESAGITCGAIFNASKEYKGVPVVRTNIPLAYIFEEGQESGEYLLHICEPDMRRPRRAHMGLLTDADVIAEAFPHDTEIVLAGHYEAEDGHTAVYDGASGTTKIVVTTKGGENYSFSLRKL